MRWQAELRETELSELVTMAGAIALVIIAAWIIFKAMGAL